MIVETEHGAVYIPYGGYKQDTNQQKIYIAQNAIKAWEILRQRPIDTGQRFNTMPNIHKETKMQTLEPKSWECCGLTIHKIKDGNKYGNYKIEIWAGRPESLIIYTTKTLQEAEEYCINHRLKDIHTQTSQISDLIDESNRLNARLLELSKT